MLSSGCNRTPSAVSWLPRTDAAAFPEGLLAYAAGHNIAIYDPHLAAVVAIMRGHRGAVNAVQWIVEADERMPHEAPAAAAASSASAASSSPGLLRLASGGADKQLIVWVYDPVTRAYTVQARLSGHEEGVSAVTALALHSPTDAATPATSRVSLLATTSPDLTTRVWISLNDAASDAASLAADPDAIEAPSAESGGWRCVQVLPSGRHKIMHCLAMRFVPLPARSQLRGLLALAVAGVDGKIHLWLSRAPAQPTDDVHFAPASALEGHENWITSLDWALLDPEEDSASDGAPSQVSLMLASSSQDRHIRLWKLQLSLPTADDAASTAAAVAAPSVASTSLGSRGLALSFVGVNILVVLESVLSGHDNCKFLFQRHTTRARMVWLSPVAQALYSVCFSGLSVCCRGDVRALAARDRAHALRRPSCAPPAHVSAVGFDRQEYVRLEPLVAVRMAPRSARRRHGRTHARFLRMRLQSARGCHPRERVLGIAASVAQAAASIVIVVR
jgi:hypothetical protein